MAAGKSSPAFGSSPAEEAHAPADQRVQQLLALNQAAIAITGELELEDLLQRIVDVARELVGCRYVALGVLGEDGYIARFPTSGISDADREKIGDPPRGHGLLGVMLRAGRTLRIPDIGKDPRRVGFPPNHPPMTSLLGVPIFVRGKLVGDLYLSEKIGGPEFSEEDEWLVQLLATHAATALTNSELHSQNVKAFQNLRSLQDAVQRIASHLNPVNMAGELLRYATQIAESDVAWLGLLDQERSKVVPLAVRGEGAAEARATGAAVDLADSQQAQGPSGRALREMEPQIIREISIDPSFLPWRHFAEELGLRSGVVVPLIYQGKPIGVLSLYSRRPGAYDAADVPLLRVLADHAAVALENAVHYQEVNRARARSQALLEVTRAINRLVEVDEVIALIVKSARELLDAAAVALYLVEEDELAGGGQPAIVARASIGLEATDRGEVLRLPMDRSMAGRAITTGATQVLDDTAAEPGLFFPRLANAREMRSLAVVPLVVSERTLGALGTYSDRTDAFDQEAVRLLEGFAAQAGTAVYNAGLYQEAQRGRQAAELEQQRLRELEHMKDEFLSTAAHELRTPLTTIRMSAGLAYEQMQQLAAGKKRSRAANIDSRLVDLIGLIVEGSERMQALVNDLLDLTRLEQGRTTLYMEELDLREVISAAVESTRPLFESKAQRLAAHLPEIRCPVRGDRQRLEQVIINLLSNAHKYSPPGSTVEARLKRQGEECLALVRDHGPGVPAEERERIFERFYRSSLHRQDRTASTGLGLPIARTIAEMHRGRVWVDEAPGGGSIFTLALRHLRQ